MFSILTAIIGIALVFFSCNASAQKNEADYTGKSATAGGGKERLQSMVTELSKSKNPEAGLLAKKIKAIAKELKNDGKNLGPLQPHLKRMEKASREGDYKAADDALMDAVGAAYDAEFWDKVSFKSTDGFRVYSFLSKPKNKKEFPIILLFHGGEHGSATTYQRHALRFLKAGFATLAVDYRGSSGHGDAYKAAADPAGKEIDDGIKAVEYAHNVPGTTSVGIMGGSHGAFISGNVLTRVSNITAANLNFGGYDFRALMKSWAASSDPLAKKKIELWSPVVGEPGTPEFARAETVSPYYRSENISARLLLIHGKQDGIVPHSESVNLYNKMKKDNKNVTLKLFDDGPHGFIFRSSDEAEEAYKITESFFKKHLK
jgi:dienelactone hydrolase